MSRYGINYFGADPATGQATLYGELVQNEFDATPFTVVSNDYAQTLSAWRKPGGAWTRQRLLRNSNGIPSDADDGVLLLDEEFDVASRVFTDTELTVGRFYYYALFVFDVHDGIWRIAGHGDVLVAKDFGYSNRLFDRLPEVFKSTDYSSIGEQQDQTSFLYRYLKILGYQLDHVRNESEVLRGLLDARRVPVDALPALAQQVGVRYEPAIGARAIRRLVTNAVHLWSLKGTMPGVRELSSLVTGYAALVRIGYNLALDDLDAGPVGGPGRWRAQAGATVGYRANDNTMDGFAGNGAVEVTVAVNGLSQLVLDMNHSGTDALKRKLYAIPVQAGHGYVLSDYVRSTIVDGSVTAKMRATWLDKRGMSLGEYEEGSVQGTSATNWAARPFLITQAPVGAFYLEAAVVLDYADTFTAGQKIYTSGFMVDEGTELRPWQCAREIIVSLRAPHQNYALNPTGRSTTSDWVGDGSTIIGIDHHNADDDAPYFTYFLLNGTSNVRMVKQAVVPAEAGESWFLRAGANATVNETVHLEVLQYSQGQLVGDPVLVTTGAITGQQWAELTGYYVVPSDGSVDSFKVRVGGSGGTVNHNVLVRDILITKSATDVTYFDGSTPSATQDNLWQGDPDLSISHHYPQRIARESRLRELLADYVPFQHCFTLAFAEALNTYIGGPGAIQNDRLSTTPASSSPSVGRNLDLAWAIGDSNGKSLTIRWDTKLNSVGAELDVEYNELHTVGADLVVRWNTDSLTVTAAHEIGLLWNVDEVVGRIDPLTQQPLPSGWSWSDNPIAAVGSWVLTDPADPNTVISGNRLTVSDFGGHYFDVLTQDLDLTARTGKVILRPDSAWSSPYFGAYMGANGTTTGYYGDADFSDGSDHIIDVTTFWSGDVLKVLFWRTNNGNIVATFTFGAP